MVTQDNILNSDEKLENWVRNSERSAIYEIIFSFILLFLYGFLMYQKSKGDFLWLIVGILGISFFISLSIYGATIKRSKAINNTIKKVILSKDSLTIITFSYNIIWIKCMPEKKIEFAKNTIKINKCDYPIMDKKNLGSDIICIQDSEGNNYFIVEQFFTKDVKHYLTQ